MTRFGRTISGFWAGCLAGAILGALGGMLDRGSMMILVPSGNPFWAMVGAFVGSIVGALYGLISRPPSRGVSHCTSAGDTPMDERHKEQQPSVTGLGPKK